MTAFSLPFSFIQKALYSFYTHCKSLTFILFFCYTTACSTIGKYGINLSDDTPKEVSNSNTESSDALPNQSIIDELYGLLDVEAGELIDSNKFIKILNDQPKESFKAWVNDPVSINGSNSKFPPLLCYTIQGIDYIKSCDKDDAKRFHLMKIIEALIDNLSVNINKPYFDETPFEWLIGIGCFPDLAQCLIQRPDFDISAKGPRSNAPCYHAIAASDDWCCMEGIKFLQDLLRKAGILKRDNDFCEMLEWLVRNSYHKMVEVLLRSNEITKEELSRIIGDLLDSVGAAIGGHTKNTKDIKKLLLHEEFNNDTFLFVMQHYKDRVPIKQIRAFSTAIIHNAIKSLYTSTKPISYLIKKIGIDVNAQDDYGNTPLHKAVEGESGGKEYKEHLDGKFIDKYLEIINLLINEEGINMNIKNEEGHPPLYKVLHRNDIRNVPQIVKRLFKHPDIDLNIKDDYGNAVFGEALERLNYVSDTINCVSKELDACDIETAQETVLSFLQDDRLKIIDNKKEAYDTIKSFSPEDCAKYKIVLDGRLVRFERRKY